MFHSQYLLFCQRDLSGYGLGGTSAGRLKSVNRGVARLTCELKFRACTHILRPSPIPDAKVGSETELLVTFGRGRQPCTLYSNGERKSVRCSPPPAMHVAGATFSHEVSSLCGAETPSRLRKKDFSRNSMTQKERGDGADASDFLCAIVGASCQCPHSIRQTP